MGRGGGRWGWGRQGVAGGVREWGGVGAVGVRLKRRSRMDAGASQFEQH